MVIRFVNSRRASGCVEGRDSNRDEHITQGLLAKKPAKPRDKFRVVVRSAEVTSWGTSPTPEDFRPSLLIRSEHLLGRDSSCESQSDDRPCRRPHDECAL